MRFYGVQQYWTRWSRVQYRCTLLHLTSYWSSSSVVIVLLHTALFYFNFEILWKLWNFWKFYHFEIFWNLMKFLKVLKLFENFEILWNFLTYWLAKSNFCAIKNHIALSCHIISFIDFARECNMIIYCTEISFC
jgi:hypothetical protein